jgi:hypothetical protein
MRCLGVPVARGLAYRSCKMHVLLFPIAPPPPPQRPRCAAAAAGAAVRTCVIACIGPDARAICDWQVAGARLLLRSCRRRRGLLLLWRAVLLRPTHTRVQPRRFGAEERRGRGGEVYLSNSLTLILLYKARKRFVIYTGALKSGQPGLRRHLYSQRRPVHQTGRCRRALRAAHFGESTRGACRCFCP